MHQYPSTLETDALHPRTFGQQRPEVVLSESALTLIVLILYISLLLSHPRMLSAFNDMFSPVPMGLGR